MDYGGISEKDPYDKITLYRAELSYRKEHQNISEGWTFMDLTDKTSLQTVSSNIDQGTIELFRQDYPENKNVPANMFSANPYHNSRSGNIDIYNRMRSGIIDLTCTIINGTSRNQIISNDVSKDVESATRKGFRGVYNIVPPILDHITGDKRKHRLEDITYRMQRLKTECCCVCGLVPMHRCNYQITIGIERDGADNYVQINSPGAKITCRILDNNTWVITSYYQNSQSVTPMFKELLIPDVTERLTLNITFDGVNKTNTIYCSGSSSISTPFYAINRRNLPYPDFACGWIKFANYVVGRGTFINTKIFEITQTAQRSFITAIGDKKITPYGIDGPHNYETVDRGISYMEKNDNEGTIWFDVKYLDDEAYIEYLRDLVHNESWEVGIHYSESLNRMPLERSYELMENEYEIISQMIGSNPATWCSLRNGDELAHATYAYDKFVMIWRNGDAGIHTEHAVGNLEDKTWKWWEKASCTGMSYPVFTHRTDEDPAIPWSISYPNFITGVDNYNAREIKIIPFGRWWDINSNTNQATFNDIASNGRTTSFKAFTNGAYALANVNIRASRNTEVYDDTAGEDVKWEQQPDGSITFKVENKHRYKIITY